MPPQPSVTVTSIRPSAPRRVVTTTVPPDGVCRIALPTRLVTARASSSAFPAYRQPVVAGWDVETQLDPPTPCVRRELAGHVVGQLDETDHRPLWRRRRGRGVKARQLKRSPTRPLIRSTVCCIWRSAAVRSSMTPSSRPSASARRPARGVRRSCDRKATNSPAAVFERTGTLLRGGQPLAGGGQLLGERDDLPGLARGGDLRDRTGRFAVPGRRPRSRSALVRRPTRWRRGGPARRTAARRWRWRRPARRTPP